MFINKEALLEISLVESVNLGQNSIKIKVGKRRVTMLGNMRQIANVQRFTGRSEIENAELFSSLKGGLFDAITVLYYTLSDDDQALWEGLESFGDSFDTTDRIHVMALASSWFMLVLRDESEVEKAPAVKKKATRKKK